MSRLIAASAPATGGMDSYSHAYTYDMLGNIATVSEGSTTTYHYNSIQPHAVDSLSGATTGSYTYDVNGNMTQRTEGGITYNQAFDVENRLESVTVGGSSTNHGDSYLVWQNATDLMIYKSSGNTLVLQTSTPLSNTNGQTHRYKVTYNPTNGQFAVWRDGVSVLNWTDSNTPHSSGSYMALRTNKSVVRFDNIRITGNPATNSTLYHLYGDHLGSTSVLADSSGQVVDKTYYLPFGEYRRGDSSILTESGFTGHLHNDSLGLIYMNARFYSQSSGRFITADTIIPDPQNPQTYNRYAYVYNNPLS